MKIVKNINSKSLEASFSGWTYFLPKGNPVFVEDDVFDYIMETWPKSFWEVKKPPKDSVIPTVTKKKTPSFLKPAEEQAVSMRVTSRNGMQNNTYGFVDETPASGKTDADGVSWYGEGIEVGK
jgi:hypothetical protein